MGDYKSLIDEDKKQQHILHSLQAVSHIIAAYVHASSKEIVYTENLAARPASPMNSSLKFKF
jgi:hypothetical protein